MKWIRVVSALSHASLCLVVCGASACSRTDSPSGPGASSQRAAGATQAVPTTNRPAMLPATLPAVGGKVRHSDAEWHKILTPEQYRVCRQKGTERAFRGAYHDTTDPGTYYCVACGQPVFRSETKFHSGTGWPSFWSPVPGAVDETSENGLGSDRTEVTCSRCGSHLGHVFTDGPKPTGLRYCINSVALRLVGDK